MISIASSVLVVSNVKLVGISVTHGVKVAGEEGEALPPRSCSH